MASTALDELGDLIEQYLKDVGLKYTRESGNAFNLSWEGGAKVRVKPGEWTGWGPDKTLVVWVRCVVAKGVRVDPGLHEYVATINDQIGLGRFALHTEAPASVIISNNLLGDFLNRAELELAVRIVAFEANKRGEEIRSRWGGEWG